MKVLGGVLVVTIMIHRHNGYYVSNTPKRNRVVYKKRPMHSQSEMNRYKAWKYHELRKKFKIDPNADDDKDGVINKKDCRPWDKKRHILFFTRKDDDINIEDFEKLSEEEKDRVRDEEFRKGLERYKEE